MPSILSEKVASAHLIVFGRSVDSNFVSDLGIEDVTEEFPLTVDLLHHNDLAVALSAFGLETSDWYRPSRRWSQTRSTSPSHEALADQERSSEMTTEAGDIHSDASSKKRPEDSEDVGRTLPF